MTIKWHWRPVSSEIKLDDLFDPVDKLCFLSGSGISVDPPSCLPTGYQFAKALLEQLIPKEKITEILSLMNPERENMQNSNDFIRFEQLMEDLQRWFDPQLRVLDCYAECSTPNFNHIFLAQMLKQGHKILTTNFDSLIEHALLKTNVKREQIFPLIDKSDWEKNTKTNHYRVYKLHGSLVDFRNNQDCRQSLQATLAQIDQGKGETFQLEPWKRIILEKILHNHDLIVLGYSGLDDFDIIPTLWNISSTRRILWINHDKNHPLKKANIRTIKVNKHSQISDLNFRQDRVSQNLLQFSNYQTREPSQIFHITVNTRDLLSWLWNRYVDHPPPELKFNVIAANLPLSKQLSLSESQRWLFTGKLFYNRHCLSQSLQAYRIALKLSQNEGNKQRQGACLTNIGLVFYDQGKIDEALNYYQQANVFFKHPGSSQAKATNLNNLAKVLIDKWEFDKALECFQDVYEIYNQLNDENGKASALNNIGGIFLEKGEVNKALDYYFQVLKITKNQGNLITKANTLHNIGRAFSDQRKLDDALDYYQKALSIFKLLGEFRGVAMTLNNIGGVLFEKGQVDEALDYYQQVLELTEKIGYFQEKARCFNKRGRLFGSQGMFIESLSDFQQAVIIAENLGDPINKAVYLSNIGTLYYEENQRIKALEHFQQSLTIFEQLEKLREKADILSTIALILYQERHRKEALENFRLALSIAEQLDDSNLIKEIQKKLNEADFPSNF